MKLTQQTYTNLHFFDPKFCWTKLFFAPSFREPKNFVHKIFWDKQFFVHIGAGIIWYKLIIYIILFFPFAIKLAGSVLDDPLFH